MPRDVTVVLIEHDMGLVFRFAERITVMVGGKVQVNGGIYGVEIDKYPDQKAF